MDELQYASQAVRQDMQSVAIYEMMWDRIICSLKNSLWELRSETMDKILNKFRKQIGGGKEADGQPVHFLWPYFGAELANYSV